MSGGACTEQNTEHSECIFHRTLHHKQIPSCGRSKDSEILEAFEFHIRRRLASGVSLDAFQTFAFSAVKEGRKAEHAASEQDQAARLGRRR